ncbi:Anti-sigma-E factor RseA [Dickeya dianthicola]|uniref:Anti-sigma-E factor RseA n=1 Tax=Dickeya dianthicola TaxID=204039 RepID=A0AAP6S0P8_9GAMM|nr:anti-sigma-E factor RseA [Dickeya dianthicola]ATO34217.1 Sigma factor RpoE negative regulatory protein RseA [Dickeya dianthicola RNS04.9]AYC20166.1 Anti-sigma-E factor RseA [Dickeya dianthicola]MBI0438786.1 anti-sigma-E factor RseA [Dickeya dianthicola]MBI0448953.1 anti-sigma-E factor RseA [Dickeya dianthicola]MBI0453551.1 anti-sigma-E factor RseA [Dickeya dianthicola]
MQKEKLSALMDGEAVDNALLGALSKDDKLQQSWQRYHLVRDTLRGDVSETLMNIDIAARVAAALEQEPVQFNPQAVPESQPHPRTWQMLPFWRKVRPLASHLTQIGMAACVSLAVIVGVQHYQQNNVMSDSVAETAPALSTLPVMGGSASPVSLSVPAENSVAHTGQRQMQAQHERINALLQDYELQRRVHSDQLQLQQQGSQQQAAVQVPGTQSLGIQPQ